MKIGIVTPTRGLVFSRTIEAIEKERRTYEVQLYVSNDLPIPNGHNSLCEKALADGNDYILFIEEDVVIPAGSIEKMLALNTDIACTDYGVSGWSCITKNTKGEILWCGLGCTLVKKEVFEALEKPYFRADMVLDLPDFRWRQLPDQYIKTRNYGSLDIWFCCQARERGFVIKQVEGSEAQHLQLVTLGGREKNYGVHEIIEKPTISHYQTLKGGE